MPSIIVTSGEWKESNICSCKRLPASTPTSPLLHQYTIFISSKPCFTSLSMGTYEEQQVDASQAPFLLTCVCIYTPQFTYPLQDWRATHQLSTDNPDHREQTERCLNQGCSPARRDGGRERMCDTGSRWYSWQLILKRENLAFLISLLTTVTLDKSIPMTTALSITL